MNIINTLTEETDNYQHTGKVSIIFAQIQLDNFIIWEI